MPKARARHYETDVADGKYQLLVVDSSEGNVNALPARKHAPHMIYCWYEINAKTLSELVAKGAPVRHAPSSKAGQPSDRKDCGTSG